MRNRILFILMITMQFYTIAQNDDNRKAVLDNSEIDFITSYYSQEGNNSAVNGGLGTEQLIDIAADIIFVTPIKKDNILTINAGVSAYTSASSGKINPFNRNDNDEDNGNNNNTAILGSPWQTSSGASQQDALATLNANYSHHNVKRTRIYDANVSFSNEYDYTSIGFGGGFSQQLNDANTEIGIKFNVYLDQWRPIYPIEFRGLNSSIFDNSVVYDQNGLPSNGYNPTNFKTWSSTARNSFSTSISLAQVVNKSFNLSAFFDLVYQSGQLSTPFNRIYFANESNYYLGDITYLDSYETSDNRGLFHLADAIEKLPDSRFKLPFGVRANYFLNDVFVFRGYYRYYFDDWGLNSHTFSLEAPIKVLEKLTITPMYRFYNQNQVKYFAPYESHLSSSEFYTSDYDLSAFDANQYGIGINYQDIFNWLKIYKFGFKNIEVRYQNYNRNNGLNANIITIASKIVIE